MLRIKHGLRRKVIFLLLLLLLPFFQSDSSQARSLAYSNIAPVTAFTDMERSSQINWSIRSSVAVTVSLAPVQREKCLLTSKLQCHVADLHPVVQTAVQDNRNLFQKTSLKRTLPKFQEKNFVLLARTDFTAAEKLSLRFHGPRLVNKAESDYLFQREDLRNAMLEDV